jgi:hypothetical protein
MHNSNFQPNIGNSIFPGFNDIQGLMLCGYEWGFSSCDQKASQIQEKKRNGVPHVFSNKAAEYGEAANSWKYDQRIIYWFELFGHRLIQKEAGGNFEKCLLQTNWCDTQNNKMEGDYWSKLLAPSQVNNFISHVEMFRPRLIFFFGSQIIKILQSDKVLPRFIKTAGKITEPLSYRAKEFDGRVFKIGFQCFEHCKAVCFPHPSGSHGLSDEYIKLFSSGIGELIREFREFKRVG